MKHLPICTLCFVALIFALAPSALTAHVSPIHISPMSQVAQGPVPWPPPGNTFQGPVPWPGPGVTVDGPVPWPGPALVD